MSRAPNLLVIGAMKAGTTSICGDLGRHPDVWFPEGKEPNGLSRHLRGEIHALNDWRRLYTTRSERWLGDGSTGNSKVPFNPDCAGLAAEICGADARIVYVTRDPLQRVERHIAHEIGNGNLVDVEGALFSSPEFLACSAYDMQLSYWRRYFSHRAILRISFEDYLSDRDTVLKQVCEHLEIAPEPLLGLEKLAANRGDSRRTAHKSVLRPILHSRAYSRLRELLPRRMRRAAAEKLLPRATRGKVCLTENERTAANRALAALDALDAPDASTIVSIIAQHRDHLD